MRLPNQSESIMRHSRFNIGTKNIERGQFIVPQQSRVNNSFAFFCNPFCTCEYDNESCHCCWVWRLAARF